MTGVFGFEMVDQGRDGGPALMRRPRGAGKIKKF